MMRPARAVWLALVFGGIACAQEPTPKEQFEKERVQLVADTKAKLKSEDVATVAWAAHAAAEYRLAECIPELTAKLESFSQLPGFDGRYAHLPSGLASLAVLDALIETEAVVPGKLLVPFLIDPWSDAALLLLGRNAKENRAILLEQFRKRDPLSEGSLACGTWLAEIFDTDFVRDLLAAPIPIDVLVIGQNEPPDTEASVLRIKDLSFPSRTLPWSSHAPKDFPGVYRSLRVGSPGDTDSIRTRRLTRSGSFWDLNSPYDARVRGARNAWVRHSLFRRDLEFDLAPMRCVRWQDANAMSGVIRDIRTKTEAAHAALVAACVKEGVVPSAAAIGKPTFVVSLEDCRSDKTTPLPESREWSLTRR